ncbi:cbb3-type cytochrome c oxidase N-terminal domain-containing protein [Roseivirga seohaensis]|uniref:cbb3-type cytochrome c oxidase N-terminal domain-containing protein n=1 Tax=Roseivirga seohaensis TaxID=1914963 RepID=UPI000B1AC672|nr:cbb3-type cytochrome c oxidase N-terminal domain-containing protein [Roseivirga seohaensis]
MERIKSKNKNLSSKYMLLPFLFLTTPLAAQTESSTGISQTTAFYVVIGLLIIVSLLVILLAFNIVSLLKAVVQKEMSPEKKASMEKEPSWFAKTWAKWNDLKPLEEEQDIMLDHDYDGIKELDNHLPPWWKALFYLSIVYAVIYLMVFHVFKSAPLQEEEYEIEMALAQAAKSNMEQTIVVDFDESNVPFNDDAEALADGKKFFEAQCGMCHKADGGGLAGPNLTDDYWKHGGSMTDIYNVIKNGVPNTAMISWESKLNPLRLQNVASYVKSLRGTNPPGALPPDGELYVEESNQ